MHQEFDVVSPERVQRFNPFTLLLSCVVRKHHIYICRSVSHEIPAVFLSIVPLLHLLDSAALAHVMSSPLADLQVVQSNLGLSDVVQVLQALQQTRLLSTASMVLLIYDYFLTLDREVKFFWAGPWGISRILFFMNRYLTPMNMILLLACLYLPNLTAIECDAMYRVLFAWWFISIFIIQVVLILRAWYLFLRKPLLRRLLVATFVITTTATVIALALYFRRIRPWEFPHITKRHIRLGCPGPGPAPAPPLWPLLLPPFALHTVLFLLTVYVGLSCERLMRTPLQRRLIRDGSIFYVIVFFSVGYALITSGAGGFQVKYTSILSEFPFVIMSISINRIMLALRNLAANCARPDDWITEMLELRAMRHGEDDSSWRRGHHDKEFLVEVGIPPGEEETRACISASQSSSESVDRLAGPSRSAQEGGAVGYMSQQGL